MALCGLEPFGRYLEREALCDKALSVAPNDPEILYVRGIHCWAVGRVREALAYAKRALILDPLFMPAALGYANMLVDAGLYEDSKPVWDGFCARWPEAETLACGAAVAAALNGEWYRFDGLVLLCRERGFESRTTRELIGFYRNVREPDPAFADRYLRFVRDTISRSGAVRLQDIVGLCALGMLDDAFQLADEATFAYMFDQEGSFPATDFATSALFSSTNMQMLGDARILDLCAKLGLCDYWAKTGRWPDCANRVGYDFRAEAARLAVV
jgi:tetratricopeptide (TPR) repeat protein